MVMIDIHNVRDVLAKKGIRFCAGLGGKSCGRPKVKSLSRCLGCNREYMKRYMAERRSRAKPLVSGKAYGGSADSKRKRVVDGYDFNQEEYIAPSVPIVAKPVEREVVTAADIMRGKVTMETSQKDEWVDPI